MQDIDVNSKEFKVNVAKMNSNLEDLKCRVRELYNSGIPVGVIKKKIDSLGLK